MEEKKVLDNDINETENTETKDVNANEETKNTSNNETENTKEEKKFTQKEVDKMFSERLRREEEKRVKEVKEAERLAKMNAEEKARYEIDKANKELAEREKALNRRELTAEAKDMLHDKGLSTSLAEILNYTNADTVKASIEVLEKAIHQEAEKQTIERLKGNTPKVKNSNKQYTKAEIMSIENEFERKRLIAENRELFE